MYPKPDPTMLKFLYGSAAVPKPVNTPTLYPYMREAIAKLAETPYAMIDGLVGTGIRTIMAHAMRQVPGGWVVVTPPVLHSEWKRLLEMATAMDNKPQMDERPAVVCTSTSAVRRQYMKGYDPAENAIWRQRNVVIEFPPMYPGPVLDALAALVKPATRIWIRPMTNSAPAGAMLHALGLRVATH